MCTPGGFPEGALGSGVGLDGLGGLVGGNLLEVPKGLSKSASSCGRSSAK